MCGGTISPVCFTNPIRGLSPRVRGNPRPATPTALRQGSIPACAGEPPVTGLCPCGIRVYPRVCGGTIAKLKLGSGDTGLSPRVRGNPLRAPPHVVAFRSIPACAGEPSRWAPTRGSFRVYPRVCGGTEQITVRGIVTRGLSPRVRGNLRYIAAVSRQRGSIPACAGEPCASESMPTSPRVYPRVCGGTQGKMRGHRNRTGLSPRVRGNHRVPRARRRSDGSIPACAGEPGIARDSELPSRVYPRVCGGTLAMRSVAYPLPGLSPRVRGNHPRSAQQP